MCLQDIATNVYISIAPLSVCVANCDAKLNKFIPRRSSQCFVTLQFLCFYYVQHTDWIISETLTSSSLAITYLCIK